MKEGLVPRKRSRRRVSRILGVATITSVSAVAMLVSSTLASSAALRSSRPAISSSSLIEVAPDVADNVDPDAYASDGDALDGVLFNSTLVVYPSDHSDVDPPGPATLIGGLASSYKVTSSGIIFKLRNAKDPEGNVISSADVAWSFQRMLALPNGLGHFLLGLAGLNETDPTTILGPKTIEVNDTVNPLTLAYLEEFSEGILDKAQALKHATTSDPWATDWLKTHSDSFGPYYVSSFNPTVSLTLKANPDYYGTAPYFKTVIIQAVTDAASRLELVESGQAQVDTSPSLDEIRSARGNASIEAITEPSLADDALTLNNTAGPFKSPYVRRAISEAINRKALLSGVYFNIGELPTGIVSEDIPQASPPPPVLPNSDSTAKALLAKGGYPTGFSFTLDWNPEALASGAGSTLITYLQEDLAKIGVTMTPVEVPSLTTYDAAIDTGQKPSSYQSWLGSNRAIIADGGYEMNLSYTQHSFNNPEQYSNLQFDAFVSDALASTIGPNRYKYVAKANEILTVQAPVIPLMDVEDMYIAAKGISGFSANDHATVYLQYLTYSPSA
jgi:peptide/nickel transport system substrate-binding protein